MKRNHPFGTSQENFSITRDTQSIFVDGRERKSIVYVIILRLERMPIKNRKSLVCNQKKMTTYR